MKNLLITVKIFSDEEWDSQVKFHYEPKNVNCIRLIVIPNKKIIFNMKDPYYENVWKQKEMKKDIIKTRI